jgi:dihydroorotate dehydrogenase (NAD+) catalytic subunit
LELVLAGASAISVGTATFGDPTAVIKIRDELESLLIERGFNDFKSAIGYAHRQSA